MAGGGDIPVKPGVGQGAGSRRQGDAAAPNDWSDPKGPIAYEPADIARGFEPTLAEGLDPNSDGRLTEREFAGSRDLLDGLGVRDRDGMFQRAGGFGDFKRYAGKGEASPGAGGDEAKRAALVREDFGLWDVAAPRRILTVDEPARERAYGIGRKLLKQAGRVRDHDAAQRLRGEAGQIFLELGFKREAHLANHLMAQAARRAGRHAEANYYLALRAMANGDAEGVASLLKGIPQGLAGREVLAEFVRKVHALEGMSRTFDAAAALVGAEIALMEKTENSFAGRRIFHDDYSLAKGSLAAFLKRWREILQGGELDSTREIFQEIWRSDSPEERRGLAIAAGNSDLVRSNGAMPATLDDALADFANDHVTLAMILKQEEEPSSSILKGELKDICANAGEEGMAEVAAVASVYKALPEYSKAMGELISSEFEDPSAFVTIRNLLHGATQPSHLISMLGGYFLAKLSTAWIMGRLAQTAGGEILAMAPKAALGVTEATIEAGGFVLFQRALTAATSAHDVDWSGKAILKDWASLALSLGFLRATAPPLALLKQGMAKVPGLRKSGPAAAGGANLEAKLTRPGSLIFGATGHASQVGAFYAGGQAAHALALRDESPKLFEEWLTLVEFQAATRLANMATNGWVDRKALEIRQRPALTAAHRIADGVAGGERGVADHVGGGLYMAHARGRISARQMVRLGRRFAKGKGASADAVIETNLLFEEAGIPLLFDGSDLHDARPADRARYVNGLRNELAGARRRRGRGEKAAGVPPFRTISVASDAGEVTIGRARKSSPGPDIVIAGVAQNISGSEIKIARAPGGWRFIHGNGKFNRVTLSDAATDESVLLSEPEASQPHRREAILPPGRYRVVIEGREMASSEKLGKVEEVGEDGVRRIRLMPHAEVGDRADPFVRFILELPPHAEMSPPEAPPDAPPDAPPAPRRRTTRRMAAVASTPVAGSFSLVRQGGRLGQAIEVDIKGDEGEVVIGREAVGKAADGGDGAVSVISQRHATIARRGDGSFWIRDGAGEGRSSNGTLIWRGDSSPTVVGQDWVRIEEGDVLGLGWVRFAWRWNPPAPETNSWEPVFHLRVGDRPVTFAPPDASGRLEPLLREDLPLAVRRGGDGEFQIMDLRDPKDVDELPPLDLTVMIDVSRSPFTLNGGGRHERLKGKMWHGIKPGDIVTAGGGVYSFGARLQTPLDRALDAMAGNPAAYNAAVSEIQGAGDLAALRETLAGLPSRPEMEPLHPDTFAALAHAAGRELAILDACLKGAATSDSLSSHVRDAFLKAIEGEAALLERRLNNGFVPELGAEHSLSKGSERAEHRYHALRAALELKAEVERAGNLDAVLFALLNSPLESAAVDAEGVKRLMGFDPGRGTGVKEAVDAANSLSEKLGVKQKVWEFSFERKGVQAASLDAGIRSELMRIMSYDGGRIVGSDGRRWSATELEDVVYRVMERGLAIEHVTSGGGVRELVERHMALVVARVPEGEWPRDGHNYFTGESFLSKEYDWHGRSDPRPSLQRRYRFARMYLNMKEGRAILGRPTEGEVADIAEFAQRAFSDTGPTIGTYDEAQRVIRREFDSFLYRERSDGIREALDRASPEARASVVAAYFGPFRHRRVADPAGAVALARIIGEAGLYREVAATADYPPGMRRPATYMSMGDLSYVETKGHGHIVMIHTHPVQYLDRAGRGMGMEGRDGRARTIAMDITADADTSTLNVLFSRRDLEVFVRNAKDAAWHAGRGDDVSQFYEPRAGIGILRSYVQHPFGAAVALIAVNVRGDVLGAEIRFAINPAADIRVQGNRDWGQSKRELEAMADTLKIPVRVTKADDYDSIWADLPVGATWHD